MPPMASLNAGSKQIRLRINPHSLARLCLQVAGRGRCRKAPGSSMSKMLRLQQWLLRTFPWKLLRLGNFRMYVPMNERSGSLLVVLRWLQARHPSRARTAKSLPVSTDIDRYRLSGSDSLRQASPCHRRARRTWLSCLACTQNVSIATPRVFSERHLRPKGSLSLKDGRGSPRVRRGFR